jgi:hypothetical protein
MNWFDRWLETDWPILVIAILGLASVSFFLVSIASIDRDGAWISACAKTRPLDDCIEDRERLKELNE